MPSGLFFIRKAASLAAIGILFSGFVPAEAGAEEPAAVQQSGSAGASGTLMNPAIAVDGLFALALFNRTTPTGFQGGHDPHINGFNIQQVELTFGANVDPYFRADANIVLTTEGVEIEEAYATTLGLPAGFQIKAGQFLTAYGRFNPTHPHTWDFANMPLVNGRFFGGDGIRNPGIQVSWLTPLPWYSELIASAQNSTGSNPVSYRGDGSPQVPPPGPVTYWINPWDFYALLRWNNFFSLTDELSLNVGLNFMPGPNTFGPGFGTKIMGADLFFKYRKLESLSFLAVTLEGSDRLYDTPSGTLNDWGVYLMVNYRLPEGFERWHVGIRGDVVGPRSVVATGGALLNGNIIDPGIGAADVNSRFRISPVVTFYPSEFSKLRLQYDYDQSIGLPVQHVGILQLEFLMGAHGAHKF